MKLLSIIIPSRNEEFLQNTIDDVFQHSELGDDMEVLVGDDGSDKFPFHIIKSIPRIHPPIESWPNRYRWLEEEKSIGQRAMQNKLAKIAEGKYLLKLDAHVSMSQGFDKAMLEIMEANPNIVLVPAFTNLHVYNWVCPQGHRTYQGKVEKCSQCEETKFTKELVWKNNTKIYSDFKFNNDLIFEYGDVENYEMLHEVAAIQGSGFIVSRDNYWKWNLCDESWEAGDSKVMKSGKKLKTMAPRHS